jgi:glycerol-3-phosphate acyltransferase PlsY
VQLGFHGGKGVATAFGAALVYDAWVAVAALVIAGVVLGVGVRFVASGILGTMLTPMLALLAGRPGELALGFGLMAMLVLAGHRKNVEGILRGEPLMRRRKGSRVGVARPDRAALAEGEPS